MSLPKFIYAVDPMTLIRLKKKHPEFLLFISNTKDEDTTVVIDNSYHCPYVMSTSIDIERAGTLHINEADFALCAKFFHKLAQDYNAGLPPKQIANNFVRNISTNLNYKENTHVQR